MQLFYVIDTYLNVTLTCSCPTGAGNDHLPDAEPPIFYVPGDLGMGFALAKPKFC